MGKFFLTVGLIGLCHAAYSATQHRNYLRLTDADKGIDQIGATGLRITSLPLDIVVQTLFSLLLSCIGLISISAKFRPIKITSEWENKTWDNVGNRTSFWSFQHRGQAFFSPIDSVHSTLKNQSLGSEFQIPNKPTKQSNQDESLKKLLEQERLKAAQQYANSGANEDYETTDEEDEIRTDNEDDSHSDEANEKKN